MTILGLDIGTTGLKMGVLRADENGLTLLGQFSQQCPINVYNEGLFADIEPEWQRAVAAGCRELGELMSSVKLTLDVYNHWIPGGDKDQVDGLDSLGTQKQEKKSAQNEG